MKKTVAIVGASGYAGGELIRLVCQHPNLELVRVTANGDVGKTVSEVHSELVDVSLSFVETNPENLSGIDIVFIALPHTKSAEVAAYLSPETLVLDCGADFRLESKDDFEKFYGSKHPGTWLYGMPELILADGSKNREKLFGAKRIAVPGCNATAITLAYAPLIKNNLVDSRDLVSTLSVGTSGAGKNAEVNTLGLDSAFAYQVAGVHRHIPEVKQNLQQLTPEQIALTFTPVLVPMFRGILAVNTATLRPGITLAEVDDAFSVCFDGERFIEVLSPNDFPNTKAVEKINKAQIGFGIDEETKRVIVISTIDNLVKGTAGAAIQSMNLALGFAEDTGLELS